MHESPFLKQAEEVYARFKTMSGLEYLRHAIAQEENYPFGEMMKMRVTAAEDGAVTLEAEPSYQFYNPMMRVHGGYLATLVDSSMGSAVLSKLPAGTGAGTVTLAINYVKKVEVETGTLFARAVVLHAGRSMLTAETKITDAHGKLYVHGSGTFLIYQK
jgi:uncharacterized protein (TIGR00369 family)